MAWRGLEEEMKHSSSGQQEQRRIKMGMDSTVPVRTAQIGPNTSLILCSLPALSLSAACLLPYLNKAFTIDDPFFLLMAQQTRKAPLHPMALDICWAEDTDCGPIAHNMPGNILMSYYLLPVANRADPEWLAHLMQIMALWCGIAATVSLAFRFGFGTFAACAAGLLVAAAPPVLAMASTAMPDILAMTLGVIGIERLLAWIVLRNRLWLFPIGLCLPVIWKVWNHPGHRVWTNLFAGVGALVLIDVLLWSFQSRDQWRIACALWLLIPLVALPYVHFPVKYLVPCAPAAALLIPDLLPPFPCRPAPLCGIVASGVIFGSMVLLVAAHFAAMRCPA